MRLHRIPYWSENPFEQWPDLRKIWINPDHQEGAEAATICDLCPGSEGFDEGPIYLIMHGPQAIGITGLYDIGSYVEKYIGNPVGLRWTGIVPQFRRLGLGAQALVLLTAEAKLLGYDGLVEFVPWAERKLIWPFFMAQGFVPWPVSLTDRMGPTWAPVIKELK